MVRPQEKEFATAPIGHLIVSEHLLHATTRSVNGSAKGEAKTRPSNRGSCRKLKVVENCLRAGETAAMQIRA